MKRVLALFIIFAMLLTMIPGNVLAAGDDGRELFENEESGKADDSDNMTSDGENPGEIPEAGPSDTETGSKEATDDADKLVHQDDAEDKLNEDASKINSSVQEADAGISSVNEIFYSYPVYINNTAADGIDCWTTGSVSSYTVVDGSTTTWSSSTTGGWYVVNSTLTINSSVTVSGKVNLILCDGCSLTVNSQDGQAGICVQNSGDGLTVYAGNTGATIAGSGILEAHGGSYTYRRQYDYTYAGGAGIGGSAVGTGSGYAGKTGYNITINGGNVKAYGGNKDLGGGGAGIGGGGSGDYKGGAGKNIIINGGTVYAEGTSGGAGIGGGATGSDHNGYSYTNYAGGAGENIIINGGKVTAISKTEYYIVGAGIGGGGGAKTNVSGGSGGTANNIIINDGYVKATSEESLYSAAGIGSGINATAKNIYIKGGEVTVDVTEDSGAAAIGGGEYGNVSGLYITGGNITASSGQSGINAIGSGKSGSASEKIYASADIIVKADNNTSPSTLIEHTSDEDITSKLNGNRYVTMVTPVYEVTEADCANGSVSVGKTKKYKAGATVTITPSPNSGYGIDKIYYNDGTEQVITPVDGIYSFTMPSQAVTVGAKFQEVNCVCEIDGWKYETVAIALSNIKGSTQKTIKMIANTQENITVAGDKNVILDLNGYVIKGTGNGSTISNSGTLSVVDNNKSKPTHYFTEGTDNLWVWNQDASVTGFCCEGGVITGSYSASGYGSGIRNQGTLTVNGINIIGNRTGNYGGGIRSDSSNNSLTVTNCYIAHNYAVSNGGGIAIDGATSSFSYVISGTEFTGNKSKIGGGADLYKCNVQINDCIFTNNVSTQDAGAIKCTLESTRTAVIKGGYFKDNTASVHGGVMKIESGNVTLDSALCEYNTGKYGGAVSITKGAVLTAINTTFIYNTATDYGGAVCNDGSVILEYCSIRDNKASSGGGGGINMDGSGGATASLLDCCVSENKGNNGGGIRYWGAAAGLTLKGKTEVDNNTNSNGTTVNNVYIRNGRTIAVAEPDSSMSVGVYTEATPTDDAFISITGENSGNYAKYFCSDNSTYSIVDSVSGEAHTVKLGTVVATVTSGDITTNYKTIQEAVNYAQGDTAETAKTVVICANVTQSATLQAGKYVTIDLNGYIFQAPRNGTAIINNGNLTLTDTASEAGNLKGAAKGILQNGTLTLAGKAKVSGGEANIYLSKDKLISVASGYSGSAGVTTEADVKLEAPVAITDTSSGDQHARFTSDRGYGVEYTNNQTKLVAYSTARLTQGTQVSYYGSVSDAVAAANASEVDCEITILRSCSHNGQILINNANNKRIALNTGDTGVNLSLRATANYQSLIRIKTPLDLKGNGGLIDVDVNNRYEVGVVFTDQRNTNLTVRIYDGFNLNVKNGGIGTRIISIWHGPTCYIYGGRITCSNNYQLSTLVCGDSKMYVFGGEFHWNVTGPTTYWAGVTDSSQRAVFEIFGGYFDGPMWWANTPQSRIYKYYGGKYTTNKVKNDSTKREGTLIWTDYIGEDTEVHEINENKNGTTYYYELTHTEKKNCTAVVEGSGSVDISNPQVALGESCTYTAIPASGNEFVCWKDGETTVSTGISYTVENIQKDVTLTAVFKETEVLSHEHEGDSIIYDQVLNANGTITYKEKVANVYLNNNVTLTSNITVESGNTLNLCLNGYVLKGTGSGSVITNNGGTVNIVSCETNKQTHYFTEGNNMLWNWNGDTAITDFSVEGGCITGGNVSGAGGGIFSNGGTLTIKGITIAGNNCSTYGGGIRGASSAVISMTDTKVIHNYAGSNSGGIGLDNSSLTLSGGSVSYNKSKNGGAGLYAYKTIAFSATNCLFKGNAAGSDGAGMIAEACQSDITLTKCEFDGNTASRYGGALRANGSNGSFKLTLDNCNLHNNKGTQGGAIKSDQTAIIMKNCTLSKNEGTSTGGAMQVWEGSLSLTDTTVSGNTSASEGGGIYSRCALTINGSSIKDNKSGAVGGGLFISSDSVSTITVSGKTVITGNTYGTTMQNLYLDGSKTLTIVSEGLSAGANIGITAKNLPATNSPVTFSGANSSDYSEFFFADNLSYEVISDSNDNNKLKLAIHNHDGIIFDQRLTSSGSIVYADNVANVFLNGNVTLTNNITVESGKTLNLCLNGYVLKGTGSGSVITNNGGTVNIVSCETNKQTHYFTEGNNMLWNWNSDSKVTDFYTEGGTITGGIESSNGGGGIRSSGGTMNISNVSIVGNQTTKWGGGVRLNNSGVLTLTDTNILHNFASSSSGGISIDGASMTINGGSVSYNKSADGGGVYPYNAKSFTATNCLFKGNVATGKGGGIYIVSTASTFTGCEFDGNTASNYAGAVRLDGSFTTTFDGCNFHDNKGTQGGAIKSDNAAIIMKNCTLTNNEGTDAGGAMQVWAGSLSLTDTTISGNTSASSGGGIFSRCALTISDSTITDNSSGAVGGGLFVQPDSASTAVISGKTVITGNKYGTTVQNLYLDGSKTFNIDSSGLSGKSKIGVTTANAPTLSNRIIISGNNSTDYSMYFSADNPVYRIICDASDSNRLKLTLHDHDGIVFDQILGTNGAITYTDNVANVLLTEDINLTSNIVVSKGKTLNLCLNGHVLKGTGNGNVLWNYGILNVYDCSSNNNKHYFTYKNDAAWEYLSGHEADGSEVAYEDITFAKLVSGTTVIEVTGGAITGGLLYGTGGGGIRNDNKLTVSGINIVGNVSNRGSGVFCHWDAGETVNMTDVNIFGNYAIHNDTENEGGGAVYMSGQSALTMEGCRISYNTTAGNGTYSGGGLYVKESATASLKNCEVSYNSVASYGGGIFASGSAQVTISGKMIVANNTKGTEIQNVYLPSGKTLAIGNEGLTGNSSIGVKLANGSGKITSNGTPDDLPYFLSDNNTYTVAYITDHLELTNLSNIPGEVKNSTYYASLTLNDSIDINFSMKEIIKADFDLEKIKIYVDGSGLSNEGMDYNTESEKGILSTRLSSKAASHMGESIHVVVVYNNYIVKAFDYSIRKYCNTVLENEGSKSPEEYTELGKLCYAALNYGAWAQKQFKYDLRNPVNEGYVDADLSSATSIVDPLSELGSGFVSNETITDAGASLSLGSNISLILTLYTNEKLEAGNFTVTNELGQKVGKDRIYLEQGKGSYRLIIRNISAGKLSRYYTISGYGITFRYSPYTYCSGVVLSPIKNEITETLQSLCKAVYLYGEAAKAYINSL